MRKTVAVGIAGATAVVVAAWRQIQRDNSLETEPGSNGDASPKAPVPRPAAPEPKPAERTPAASANTLFTPSVSEKSTRAELYEVATELGVEGRSNMNKIELLEAIRSAS